MSLFLYLDPNRVVVTMPREGGHEDQQKAADGKTGSEKKPDYIAFRDKAFLHLYRSMNIAMQEMANENLHNSVRCKWKRK